MKCPACNHPDSQVTDSRPVRDEIRRRRKCKSCGFRWTTHELMTTEADLARQAFNHLKQDMIELVNNLRV